MRLDVNINGIQELQKTFQNLPKAMQSTVYRQALREGGNLVRNAAQRNLDLVSDDFTGLLGRRGSVVVYNYKKYRGSFRVGVQIKRGLVNTKKKDKDGKPVRVGLYASVLEYGSQKLNRISRPWLRKAIREEKNNAILTVQKEISRRMDFAVKRARSIKV